MNSDSIPVDLITEIFSRLPAKSTTRFICLSKLWASILRRPYFTELFLTRSSAKPHILLAIEEYGAWNFFSLPQRLMSPCEKSSSYVVTAKFHMKFLPDNMNFSYCNSGIFGCGHAASGLIHFYGRLKKDVENNYGVPVILNPNTGQYLTLPYHLRYRNSNSFFGFDPIDKQFKVLFMAYPRCSDDHKIMTLGIGKMRRRTIKCPLPHHPLSKGICVNGVLYYLGDYRSFASSYDKADETSKFVIVCFDVRSEKFKFIYVQNVCTLINYKGKLCVVYRDIDHWKNDVDAVELRVWVLEDAEKEEWSKYAYTVRDHKFFLDEYDSIDPVGVTTMGDIIFSLVYYRWKHTFCVFYFNPVKNTLQRVEIQGFGEYYNDAFPIHRVLTFPNHVEDLN